MGLVGQLAAEFVDGGVLLGGCFSFVVGGVPVFEGVRADEVDAGVGLRCGQVALGEL